MSLSGNFWLDVGRTGSFWLDLAGVVLGVLSLIAIVLWVLYDCGLIWRGPRGRGGRR